MLPAVPRFWGFPPASSWVWAQVGAAVVGGAKPHVGLWHSPCPCLSLGNSQAKKVLDLYPYSHGEANLPPRFPTFYSFWQYLVSLVTREVSEPAGCPDWSHPSYSHCCPTQATVFPVQLSLSPLTVSGTPRGADTDPPSLFQALLRLHNFPVR